MKAISIHGKSIDDIQKALDNVMNHGIKPTIAIIFISVKQDRKAISKFLNSKNIDVFGATSCGEFTNGVQTEGEIAILLLDLSKAYYQIQFKAIEDNNLENTTASIANAALEKFSNPSLIVCSTGINKKQEF